MTAFSNYEGKLPAPKQGRGSGQDQAALAARRNEAVRMRLMGVTYEEIARQLGYADRSGARTIVIDALSKQEAESVALLRKVENERLNRVLVGIWPDAIKGKLAAVDRVIRISERLARLNGLDAPISIAVSDDIDQQIMDLAEQINAAASEAARTVEGEVVANELPTPG